LAEWMRVVRSFSTTSRPARRAASGRPPARQRHDGHRGEPASPSNQAEAGAAPGVPAGPRWVREASGPAGPQRAPTVNLGMAESQVRRLSVLRPRPAKQARDGFESHLLRAIFAGQVRYRAVETGRPLTALEAAPSTGRWPMVSFRHHTLGRLWAPARLAGDRRGR